MAFSFSVRRLARFCPTVYSKGFNVINYALCRNMASDVKVNWVRPPDVPSYHPSQTGDLTPFQMPDDKERPEHFESCELLSKTANEYVKKVFAMSTQSLRQRYYYYKLGLMNKVKDHEFDYSSLPVQIAALTARIRIVHYTMYKKPSTRKYRKPLNLLLHKRRRLLKHLRNTDYKKFEWLLEQLDLKFYPEPITMEVITRKKGTRLLAQFRREKLKELKHAECRKKLDLQKVPFLEKKLKMLKHIKEQENSLQLEPTVTESDIENCIKQIQKVKIEVEENQKKGYVRKVHPYTLEVYNPKIFEKSDTN